MKYGVLDIGGSNIKAAVVDADDKVSFSKEIATPSAGKEFSDTINGLIAGFKKEGGDICAITMGVPGLVDYPHNSIVDCPNLKFKIKKPNVNVPVFLANDADLALLGEIALRGIEKESVALLTLGTGVGGAFSVAGVESDFFAYAGEIGHIKVVANGRECSCSGRGCLEAYASGWAILASAKQKISPKIETVREVFDLAKTGDIKAGLIIREMAQMLGVGLANLINILGIEHIFLAGQIAKSSRIFLPEAIKSVKANVFLPQIRNIKIEPSCDIGNIALVGGARYAQGKMKEKEATRSKA